MLYLCPIFFLKKLCIFDGDLKYISCNAGYKYKHVYYKWKSECVKKDMITTL